MTDSIRVPIAIRNFNCYNCPERLLTVEYYNAKEIKLSLVFGCVGCGMENKLKLEAKAIPNDPDSIEHQKATGGHSAPDTGEIVCKFCSERVLRFLFGSLLGIRGKVELVCLACNAVFDLTIKSEPMEEN